MKATFNGKIIAESKQTIVVEGNHYFPPDSIKKEFFKENTSTTTCPWKGQAHYYDVEVDGQLNEGCAWYYPNPKAEAAKLGITNYVAFWRGVQVID